MKFVLTKYSEVLSRIGALWLNLFLEVDTEEGTTQKEGGALGQETVSDRAPLPSP